MENVPPLAYAEVRRVDVAARVDGGGGAQDKRAAGAQGEEGDGQGAEGTQGACVRPHALRQVHQVRQARAGSGLDPARGLRYSDGDSVLRLVARLPSLR